MTIKKTILCVDDEHSLSIHKVTLETRGYRVLACGTASEALHLLAHRRVDLVLSGMALADAQPSELVRRIKSHSAEMPIVLLGSSKRVCSVDVPEDLLLRKGYAPAELLHRIRLLLAKRRGPRRVAATSGIQDTLAAC